MGYWYFFIFIAACGLVIIGYGLFVDYVDNGGKLSFIGQANNTLLQDPVPPLKKTISGLPDPDIKRDDLLGGVDIWQKEHERRRSSFDSATHSMHGTKYQYKPSGRNRTLVANSS